MRRARADPDGGTRHVTVRSREAATPGPFIGGKLVRTRRSPRLLKWSRQTLLYLRGSQGDGVRRTS